MGRLNTEHNDLSIHERVMKDDARKLARKFGKQSTAGRRPVRVDKQTVVYKKEDAQ